MHIASIGIDLGKTSFPLVALGETQQRSRAQEGFPYAVAGLYGESEFLSHRYGGVFRSTLSSS